MKWLRSVKTVNKQNSIISPDVASTVRTILLCSFCDEINYLRKILQVFPIRTRLYCRWPFRRLVLDYGHSCGHVGSEEHHQQVMGRRIYCTVQLGDLTVVNRRRFAFILCVVLSQSIGHARRCNEAAAIAKEITTLKAANSLQARAE